MRINGMWYRITQGRYHVRLLKYKILHRLQVSPGKGHKWNPQISPLCLKCKISEWVYSRSVWFCLKIHMYWLDILQAMKKILGVVLSMNFLSLLQGHPCQDAIVGIFLSRLYDILAHAARKNIFLSWISDKPHSMLHRHKIIIERFPLEYLTCLLHSTKGQFMKKWTPYLRFSWLWTSPSLGGKAPMNCTVVLFSYLYFCYYYPMLCRAFCFLCLWKRRKALEKFVQ